MVAAHLLVMQTTPTIAMTPSFGRKVSLNSHGGCVAWTKLTVTAVCVSSLLISEIKKIVKDSEIMKEDDSKWPEKNKDGRQELEIRLGNEHISFEVYRFCLCL